MNSRMAGPHDRVLRLNSTARELLGALLILGGRVDSKSAKREAEIVSRSSGEQDSYVADSLRRDLVLLAAWTN